MCSVCQSSQVSRIRCETHAFAASLTPTVTSELHLTHYFYGISCTAFWFIINHVCQILLSCDLSLTILVNFALIVNYCTDIISSAANTISSVANNSPCLYILDLLSANTSWLV